MKWVYCENCKQFFPEDEMIIRETWSHSNSIGFDGWYPEYENRCPLCYEEDCFDEAYECAFCKGGTLGDVCDDCKEEIGKALDKFIKDYLDKCENDDEELLKEIIRQWLDKEK